MKRICILILTCLLLTACQQSSATITPDNNATIVAGVIQTLNAQAPTQTQINIQTAIVQTLTAMPTSTVSLPTQSPAPATPSPELKTTNTPAPTDSNSIPRITFTSVPAIGSSKDLFGKVEGVTPNKYGVAVYIRVGGGWWTKPTFAAPVTSIASDGTWKCHYATGGNDLSATVIRAYLIPIDYKPPAMSGGSSLPSALEKTAVAKVEVAR